MPYSYSLIAPSPPWLSIATVNNQGHISIDRLQVPAIGYQGTARVRVSDGAATADIDIPIDITGRVDNAGNSLYAVDSIIANVIEIGATAGLGLTLTPYAVPTYITIGAVAGIQIVNTVIAGGGGGAGDDMVMDYQVSGSRNSTKPATAGLNDAVINAVRKERFFDTGFGVNTAIAATNGDTIECTIDRNAIWHSRVYFSGFGNSQEWLLASAGNIEITIEKVGGAVVGYLWSGNPRDLAIVPDGEGQMATIQHFNLAGGTIAGFSRWIAHRTNENTGMPTGNAGQYWDWISFNQQQWSV